ncbi:MAG TPA: hypothetical protein VG125_08425 [Pirellulales bacterium]|jgi:hypothetical protein|nr:hypothetical protein [Pirellulales bacterium]
MNLFGFQLFELTPVGLLCLVGWIVAGLAIGKLLFKDDRHLKDLQREANDCAQELAKWGFTLLPPILTDFAVLDFVTLKSDFRHAVNVMKDPAKRRAELASLLSNMVREELKDTATNQAFLDSVYSQAKAAGLKPTTP